MTDEKRTERAVSPATAKKNVLGFVHLLCLLQLLLSWLAFKRYTLWNHLSERGSQPDDNFFGDYRVHV